MTLVWVPTADIAAALDGLPGAPPPEVEVVVPDGTALPATAGQVEFYVPPFFPAQPAIAAIRELPKLAVVQALTAGVDRLRPVIPAGVTLCNARGVHDASTAEWVVGAMLAALREFPFFAREQAAQRWSYHFTDCLAGKTVLIVGYGSIGAAVERRLAGFEVSVLRVARSARPEGGVAPVNCPAAARGRRGGAARPGDGGDHRHGGRGLPGPDEGRRAAGQRGPWLAGGGHGRAGRGGCARAGCGWRWT